MKTFQRNSLTLNNLRIKNNETKDVTISYKDALNNSLKTIENPMILNDNNERL